MKKFKIILFVLLAGYLAISSCSIFVIEGYKPNYVTINTSTSSIVKLASYMRLPSYDADFKAKTRDLILNKKITFFILWDTWNGTNKARIIKQIASENFIDVTVLMYLDFQGLKAGMDTGYGTTEALYGENYSGVNNDWFLMQSNNPRYYYWWDDTYGGYAYAAIDPNPLNGWPREFAEEGLQRAINGQYFDGLFGDDLWSHIYNRSPSFTPRDYANETEWQTTVKSAIVQMGNIKNNQFSDKKLYFNLGSNHDQFEGLWEDWIAVDGIDGYLEEFYAQHTDRYLWYKDVERLENSGDLNKIEIANWWTQKKLYSDGTEVEEDKQAMFAFSSYLLGANQHSYFAFNGAEKEPLFYPIFHVDIGSPLGYFEVPEQESWSSVVYPKYAIREFENGLVIVNPKWPPRQGWPYDEEINYPLSTNYKVVPLNGEYEVLDQNGQVIMNVIDQIEVPDYTGVILRRVGTQSTVPEISIIEISI